MLRDGPDGGLFLLYPYIGEQKAKNFTTGGAATVDRGAKGLLAEVAVDHAHAQNGRDEPDMRKRDAGELDSPDHGDQDAAKESRDVVAETLAAIKAEKRGPPDAVEAVGTINLCNNVLEGGLQKTRITF